MSTTLDRLEELEGDLIGLEPRLLPPHPSADEILPRVEPRARALTLRLSPGRLGVAWLLIANSLIAFEPAPQDPSTPVPVWAALVATAFFASLAAAMAGLLGDRRWAPTAFFVAGLAGLAIAVGCLGTEHHAMPYPLLEMAGFGLLTWLSWRTMRSWSGSNP